MIVTMDATPSEVGEDGRERRDQAEGATQVRSEETWYLHASARLRLDFEIDFRGSSLCAVAQPGLACDMACLAAGVACGRRRRVRKPQVGHRGGDTPRQSPLAAYLWSIALLEWIRIHLQQRPRLQAL